MRITASVRARNASANNRPVTQRCAEVARETNRPRNPIAYAISAAPTGTTRPDSRPLTVILNRYGFAATTTNAATTAPSHHRRAAASSDRRGHPSTTRVTTRITAAIAPTQSRSWTTNSARTAANPSRPTR